MVCVPAAGIVLGLGAGLKAEKFVYPTVLLSWVIIIFMVWF